MKFVGPNPKQRRVFSSSICPEPCNAVSMCHMLGAGDLHASFGLAFELQGPRMLQVLVGAVY